jgi:ABC-type branched-subunit amino acid transport system permease subunit
VARCVSFTFASMVAAVVGGCYLMWVRYVNPESALGVPVALSRARKS